MPSHSRFALLPLALSGALLAGAVYAQQQAAPPVTDEQLRAAFNTADANRNGVVSFEEVRAYADTVRRK